jgi:hypothetical protein
LNLNAGLPVKNHRIYPQRTPSFAAESITDRAVGQSRRRQSKSSKQSRSIHGHFKPFLPEKAHGYCVFTFAILTFFSQIWQFLTANSQPRRLASVAYQAQIELIRRRNK